MAHNCGSPRPRILAPATQPATANQLPHATFGTRLEMLEHQVTQAAPLSRMTAIETSVRELGSHFVQYQESLAPILLQEFSRIMQHMQEQEDALLKKTVSQATEQVMREMKWGRLQESSLTTKSAEQSVVPSRSEEEMSKQETESTRSASEDSESQKDCAPRSASEDSESQKELARMLTEVCKDTNRMYDELSAQTSAIQERLAALETGIGAQKKELIPKFWGIVEDVGSDYDDSSTRLEGSGLNSPRYVASQNGSPADEKHDSMLQSMVTAINHMMSFTGPSDPSSEQSYVPQVVCNLSTPMPDRVLGEHEAGRPCDQYKGTDFQESYPDEGMSSLSTTTSIRTHESRAGVRSLSSPALEAFSACEMLPRSGNMLSGVCASKAGELFT